MRAGTEEYALIMAFVVREKLDATWGICELGASGPRGNSFGDSACHVAVALSGPRNISRTLENGIEDREANMWSFAE